MNNVRARDKHNQCKPKLGKIDPSHLLIENGDLSFLLLFRLTVLIGREHLGKVSKKFIAKI